MKTKRYGVLQRSVVLGVLSFLTNFNTQREINVYLMLKNDTTDQHLLPAESRR